jgi:C-terminal processing protease CtpA/Prc
MAIEIEQEFSYSLIESQRKNFQLLPYTPEQRVQVANTILNMFKMYPHSEKKMSLYGIEHPLKTCSEILSRAADISDFEFHSQFKALFSSLRDLHSSYMFPGTYNAFTFTKGIEFQGFANKDSDGIYRSIAVSNITNDPNVWHLSPKLKQIQIGDELVSIDGVSPSEYMKKINHLQRGAGVSGKFVQSIAFMTDIRAKFGIVPIANSTIFEFRKLSTKESIIVNLPWIAKRDEQKFKDACELIPFVCDDVVPELYFGKLDVPVGRDLNGPFPRGDLAKLVKLTDTAEDSIKWGIWNFYGFKMGVLYIAHFGQDVDTALPVIKNLLLNELKETDGLLIDVRNNPGGGGLNVTQFLPQLFASHDIFTTKNRVVANEFSQELCANKKFQPWYKLHEVFPVKDGEKFTIARPMMDHDGANEEGQIYAKEVGIFTSGGCYSACDAFNANMKDNKIATVFGEHSSSGGGGATGGFYNATLTAADEESYPAFPYAKEKPMVAQRVGVAFAQVQRIVNVKDRNNEDTGIISDYSIPAHQTDFFLSGSTQYDRIAQILKHKGIESGKSKLFMQVKPYNEVKVGLDQVVRFRIVASGIQEIVVCDKDDVEVGRVDIKSMNEHQTLIRSDYLISINATNAGLYKIKGVNDGKIVFYAKRSIIIE